MNDNAGRFSCSWEQYQKLWQATAALVGVAQAYTASLPASLERVQTERIVAGYKRTILGVLCDE